MGVTKEQQLAFIEKAAPAAQNGFRTLGKVLPSVAIGMACVECRWGKAGSVKWHSYLGQKVGTGKTATKYWRGKFFRAKTQEEYTVGVHTTITDAFRAYESIEQCFLNYYELLNSKLYARVQAGADYKTQMQQIKAVGYMTSSTEVNSVITIIENHGLTKYDIGEGKVVCVKETNPYKRTATLIRKGDRGDSVRWVQYALKMWGAAIVVDGIFGPKTDAAVRTYQAANGLKVDGIVGPKTIGKMEGK